MRRKSETCIGASGGPLTEYGSRSEAQEGADYAKSEYGYDLKPYICESCGYFHIGPEDRAPNKTCPDCTSAEGENKYVYRTEADARRMTELKKRRGIRLKVYACPVGNGWHLTKA